MNDIVNKALWDISKNSEQKLRENSILEECKKRERRLVKKGWRWIKTDNNTWKLQKPENNG